MARTITQQTGMAFAYHGYAVPSDPRQQNIKLPTGWEIQSNIGNLSGDWNVQRNAKETLNKPPQNSVAN